MKDDIERMVADAKAKAFEAREAQAARDRTERERRVEQDQQVAELLLSRVRPMLVELAAALNRQLEGAWHVEWFAPHSGNAALKVESREHPGCVVVEVSRDLGLTVSHRTGDHDPIDCQFESALLEPQLMAAMQEWTGRLMGSAGVRFRT